MSKHTNMRFARLVALSAIAGTLPLASAIARQSPEPRDDRRDAQDERTQERQERQERQARKERTAFVRADDLFGSDVTNPNGTKLGSVGDFIVERGSGRVEFVVLEEGKILGFGGREIAIPYPSFRTDGDGGLILGVTPEQLEKVEELRTEDWIALEEESWAKQLPDWYQRMMGEQPHKYRDPFAAGVKDAEQERVEGVIRSVKRSSVAEGPEHVTVEVQNAEGRTITLVLGPAWYVMSQPRAPMRGDEIAAEAFRLRRTGEGRYVARTAEIDGERMTLRDENGAARWSGGQEEQERTGSASRAVRSPLVLLGDVIGMPALARDEKGGEIEGAVIERRSGTVAMLILDPDENFLGINDELKLIPWSVAAIGPESVRIDADKDILSSCEKAPGDADELADRAVLRRAYGAFDIDVASFEPRQNREVETERLIGAWGKDGEFVRAFREGEDVRLSGSVVRVSTTRPAERMTPATIVVIETESGEEKVVLGPSWHVEKEGLSLKEGDEVAFVAKRARFQGEPMTAAYAVKIDGRTVMLWDGDTPAWCEK